MGNCLCCMWILLGGFVGVYLYQRDLPPGIEFSSGQGALVGLLSGIFGALFGTFLTYFFFAVWGFNPGQDIIQNILESRGDLSPEVENLLQDLQDKGGINPFFVFIGLFFSLIIDSIFGTVGGIIGAAIFKKKKNSDRSVNPEAS
ncbi:MAG: hypothetical protein ABIL68_02250, partial [bacterium]